MSTQNEHKSLEIACKAARAAGIILKNAWEKQRADINTRYEHDLKLEQDLQAEATILQILEDAYPDYGILAEEAGALESDKEFVWIVDPLDGTVNFAHGMPHFCTSVALFQNKIARTAVVYDPVRDELFSAVQGEGAFCNGAPIKPSVLRNLNEAMVAVGFGKFAPQEQFLQEMAALAARVQKLRITGAAALDICWAASGRYDAFCETTLNLWDFAAGALILREAGGKFHAWPTETQFKYRCVSSNGWLDSELLQILQLDSKAESKRYL